MADNLYRKIYSLLNDAGFYSKPKQSRGNHEIMTNGVYSVSVPRNVKSRRTANRILKDAGLPKQF